MIAVPRRDERAEMRTKCTGLRNARPRLFTIVWYRPRAGAVVKVGGPGNSGPCANDGGYLPKVGRAS